MRFLADINVWVALTFRAHQFHDAAAAWFADRGLDTCAFCRVSQHFAAFATAGGVELVTFDRGFRQFDRLRHLILS